MTCLIELASMFLLFLSGFAMGMAIATMGLNRRQWEDAWMILRD